MISSFMNPISTVKNIEQLTSQIAQLIRLLENFHEALLAESLALKSNITDQISEVLPVKQQCSNELTLLTQEIDSQLLSEQLSLSKLFSTDFSARLPETLQKQILQAKKRSERCHDLNQSNGISIQILSNINRHTIDLISGKEQAGVKLYSATGETQASKTSNKTLGKA